MRSCLIYRHADDPVHPFAHKEIHCVFFPLFVCTAVTYNGGISMATQNILDPDNDLCTEDLIQLRDHHTDGPGSIGL